MTELTKPELQSLFCSDVDEIASWEPDSDVVDYWLQLDIGEVGDLETSDQFQVRVVDFETLRRAPSQPIRACVVVDPGTYSFTEVRSAITKTVESCGQATWLETAIALSRYFLWEYEGYPLKIGAGASPQ